VASCEDEYEAVCKEYFAAAHMVVVPQDQYHGNDDHPDDHDHHDYRYENPQLSDPVENNPAIKSVFKPDHDFKTWNVEVSTKDIMILSLLVVNITLLLFLAKHCGAKEKKGKYRVVTFDAETDLESLQQ